MATVFDVAAYILKECGEMTTMKLQKLVYYCQAWHLVWEEEPLFHERIQAWANGPVAPDLYEEHKGLFKTAKLKRGTPRALNAAQRGSIDAVLKTYANKSSQWLSDLTHRELPWAEARVGLGPGERGQREISQATLAEYYSSL